MSSPGSRRFFLQAMAAVCALEAMPVFAGKRMHPAGKARARKLRIPSFFDNVRRLKNNQFLWAPQIAPSGEIVVYVSISMQRSYIYRNAVLIGVTSISTGMRSHPTYTGTYHTLEKQKFHRSNAYSNAPMPWMQRLTSWGVAMHAGHLPGRPASHGCVRMPSTFAKLLYDAAPVGTTVVITNSDRIPRIAPSSARIWADAKAFEVPLPLTGPAMWRPANIEGTVSLVLSAADRRLLVIRNAEVVGSAPVQIGTPVAATSLYALRESAESGMSWKAVGAPGCTLGQQRELPLDSVRQIGLPQDFVDSLMPLLTEGTTMMVTRDTLQAQIEGGNFTYTVNL